MRRARIREHLQQARQRRSGNNRQMPQEPANQVMRNKALRSRSIWTGARRIALASATLALLVCLCSGCRSPRPLPSMDLSSPGWRIQQGQALWKPTKAKSELAGELLLATTPEGDLFVQFSKTPFNLVTACRYGERWAIQFGSGEFSRTGRGVPPSRFAWFALPHALASGKAEGPWQFERTGDTAWRLANSRTGESLEGYLTP